MLIFENDSASAAFWFAAEEYIIRHARPDEPVLMLWRTDDTIMLGANQIAEAECDTAYANSAGIKIVRRPSGGGAIFTDKGTLQVTVIRQYNGRQDEDNSGLSQACNDPAVARELLAAPVLDALALYGVNASLEGRNDILIDGKKVSGIAQYVIGGYICSHCSLLFSADLEKLEKCLTANREKFKTKAIASLRARVANISDYIAEKDLQNFRDSLIKAYKGEQDFRHSRFSRKGKDETLHIETIISEKYLNPGWIFGRAPAFTFTNKKRFPGGLLEVYLDVKGGVIKDARLSGDFLSLLPVADFETKLVGVPHNAEALKKTLREIDVRSYLGSLDAKELMEVLL